MKRWKVVLFSGFILLAGIVIAALLFSALQSPEPLQQPSAAPGLYRKPQVPGLPHEHVPGAKGVIAGASVRINNLGFRGSDVSRQKPDKTVRIAVAGDSIVFGQGVPEEMALPCRLEKLLARKEPDRRWQVINAGVRGYNSLHYRILLEEKVLPLEPEMIILVITEINDPGREPYKPYSKKLEKWRNSVWRKVPLVREFLAASYAEEINRLFEDHVRDLYDRQGEDFKRFREDIRAIKRLCNESSVELIAVSFPMISDENMFQEQRKRLQKMLSEEGIAYIDPLPSLSRFPASKLVVGPRDFHPNGRALGIVARELSGPVLKRLK